MNKVKIVLTLLCLIPFLGCNIEQNQLLNEDLAENNANSRFVLSHGAFEVLSCDDMELVWNDKRSGGKYDGSFYRPKPPAGYFRLGHYGQGDYSAPRGSAIVIKEIKSGVIAQPLRYERIWTDKGSGASRDGAFWRPIPPKGYKALGVVVTSNYRSPAPSEVVCVKNEYVTEGQISGWIWNDKHTGVRVDMSSWHIGPKDQYGISVGSFYTHTSHSKPTATVYVLSNPKAEPVGPSDPLDPMMRYFRR